MYGRGVGTVARKSNNQEDGARQLQYEVARKDAMSILSYGLAEPLNQEQDDWVFWKENEGVRRVDLNVVRAEWFRIISCGRR